MLQQFVCCVVAGFGRQQHFRLGRGDASVSLTFPAAPLAWWESAATYQPAARYETKISRPSFGGSGLVLVAGLHCTMILHVRINILWSTYYG